MCLQPTQPHFQYGASITCSYASVKILLCYSVVSLDKITCMKSWQKIEQYFKEVIYGGIDGIVTTFAVVAGFAGASLSADTAVQLSFAVVLLFGLANLFADAASMGLGNFLSVRSEQDMYASAQDRERMLLRTETDKELLATVDILQSKGFALEEAKTLAAIYQHNESYWLDFMMMHEHNMADPRHENPAATGLATFLSFMVFGAIPLLPFMIFSEGSTAVIFKLSIVGTFVALVILGLLKWKVIGDKLASSLVEVILVGGTAATLAYLVGVALGA